MRANRHFLAILALIMLGLAVRFVPLLYSTLPFNIDGFPMVRISEDIVDTGHWEMTYPKGTSDLLTYNSKMPVLPILISQFALIFGKTPMEVTQFIIPFISSCAIVIIYAIAYKITKNELVSFFTGLALALNGFYVYLGVAVMKQTVGLVLLLLAVYLYQGREDPKKRILAAMLILILTLTHHLTAWIGFVMVSLLMLSSNALNWHHGTFRSKRMIADFFSGPFLFIFTILYYESVELSFYQRVARINDIALFASVFLMGAVFCILFSMPKKKPTKKIPNKTLIIPLGGIAILVANHYKMIFPGTLRTSASMLMYLIPYLILISIGIIGLNIIASKKTDFKPFIASIILAPIIVIIYAMLKGLDAFTFILVYRSYDYIDFGLAICAGIGMGYILKRTSDRLMNKKNQKKASIIPTASLSVIFLVICLSTVPLAYNGQEFYGVQDATYEHEFKAMNWLSEEGADYKINTDERLDDIMSPYFDLDCDQTLPWKLKWGKSVEKGEVLFMEDKWTKEGAQMSPMEPEKVKEKVFENILEKNNLIYSTGGSGSQVYIVIIK